MIAQQATRKNKRKRSHANSVYTWLESLAITLVIPVVGYYFNPEDPFFLESEFNWLLIAPLIASLRYGFGHGFSSVLLLLGAIAVGMRVNWLSLDDFPTLFALGMVITTMLSGLWADWWARRLARETQDNHYHIYRLDEFTHSYHLLRKSHDRLEHNIASQTNSMRDSLQQLRDELLLDKNKSLPLGGCAADILSLFSNFSWVQVASIYLVNDNKTLVTPALAQTGEPPDISPDDPLLQKALENKRLYSIKADEITLLKPGSPLVAAPVVDRQERIWAVITIHRMPFMALKNENLRLLAVMSSHIAHQLASSSVSPLGDEALEFQEEVMQALDDSRQYQLPSVMAILSFPDTEAGDVACMVVRQTVRGLDRPWMRSAEDGKSILLLLMPLTDSSGAEAYRERITSMINQRLGSSTQKLGIEVNTINLSGNDNLTALMNLVEQEYHLVK